ncbi:uncharacterized protein BP5553_10068 [Venustampulla echinocandica]|uniref:Uncharacterized protein n=1 Tax=Venustampulla echinocandica TaxID=2656787 RepID=A0A370TA86_9HELO|nr:uncharacterized protein BP5553_10068 [Venustampulla echinocandica]RDL30723.1 hypothetical protein BP5553_10068 [Venustampulla echinocandica]
MAGEKHPGSSQDDDISELCEDEYSLTEKRSRNCTDTNPILQTADICLKETSENNCPYQGQYRHQSRGKHTEQAAGTPKVNPNVDFCGVTCTATKDAQIPQTLSHFKGSTDGKLLLTGYTEPRSVQKRLIVETRHQTSSGASKGKIRRTEFEIKLVSWPRPMILRLKNIAYISQIRVSARCIWDTLLDVQYQESATEILFRWLKRGPQIGSMERIPDTPSNLPLKRA